MRAALYARYSDPGQNARSTGDQLTELARHAERRGWAVVASFSDAAISGAAMANRPGLQQLLGAAVAGGFDLVLIEDESRISRNLGHLAFIKDRLQHIGVTLATLATDRVDTMHVALKGLIAEQYLVDLGAKTARGMRANAERGAATGSRLYGYRSHPGGRVEIVPAEAEVVREAFARFAAGETARAIAAAFNARGLHGPHGGAWTSSALNGSRARANGLLRTELYAGVKVWNRMDVVKDPETGRRTSRLKPESAWRRTPVPDLRIVDQATWDEVAARKARESAAYPLHVARRRAGHLLTGLLRCGCCGGAYTSYTTGKMICTARRERGPQACENRRTLAYAEIERRVLAGLQARLLQPDAVAQYMRDYREAWAEAAAERRSDRAPAERRIAELSRRIERLVEAVCEGHASPALREKLADHEAERAALAAQIQALDADEAAAPIELHPSAPQRYAALVARLQAHLAATPHDPIGAEERDAFRALVIRVDIVPLTQARGGPFRIDIVGDLARFLTSPAEAATPRTMRRLVAGGGVGPSHRPRAVTIAA